MQSVREINRACFAALGLCGGGKKEKLEQHSSRQASGAVVRYHCYAALLLLFFDSPHTGGVVL